MALFATLSFALTSCGDDDDEPNGGNDKASLTINGQGYKEHTTTGASSTIADYSSTRPDLGIAIKAELYPSESDELDFFPCANISFNAESATLSKGMTLTLNEGYVEMMTDFIQGDKYDEIKSGKVTVSEVSGASVTLKFDNLKIADDDNEIITINGTLKFQYTKI